MLVIGIGRVHRLMIVFQQHQQQQQQQQQQQKTKQKTTTTRNKKGRYKFSAAVLKLYTMTFGAISKLSYGTLHVYLYIQ